jgi:hypothetical protein
MLAYDAHNGWQPWPENLRHLQREKCLDTALGHAMLWDTWPFLWDAGDMMDKMQPLFEWMLSCVHRRPRTVALFWWEGNDESKETKEQDDKVLDKDKVMDKVDKVMDKVPDNARKPDVLLTQSPTCAVEPPSLPLCEECATCGARTVVRQVAILFGSRFHFCSPMCWHEWLKGL